MTGNAKMKKTNHRAFKQREYQRKYWLKNRSKIREKKRIEYAKNPARFALACRKSVARSKAKTPLAWAMYYQLLELAKTPEERKAKNRQRYRRKILKYGKEWERPGYYIQQRKRQRASSRSLGSGYVRQRLQTLLHMSAKKIPPALFEIHRVQLQIFREIKKQKQHRLT